MRIDLPTPEQILEELADRAAAQVDRLAKVAFDAAWSEMTDYHRFLLDVNAAHGPDGEPFSFAQVAGYRLTAPHQEWVGLYNRLFERAIDRMMDDDRFLRTLAYAPGRLLPTPGAPRLPTSLATAILDLGPILVHRLEAWVTRRATAAAAAISDAEPRRTLPGSDSKAYANILPEIVGAWERALQRVVEIDDAPSSRGGSDADRWASLGATWPLAWRHLANTARCLAASVWNDDQIGSDIFREALVRWPNNLGHDRATLLILHRPIHLFPDVMRWDWPRARDRVAGLAHAHRPPPTPDQVFHRIVEGAHRDVLNVSAAVFMLWTIEGKQSSDIGTRTARDLLRMEGDDELIAGRRTDEAGLASRLLGHLRLHMAGEPHGDGSFANDLDRLVMDLDTLTERRVVPGRVFTPSTSFGREDLLMPAVASLAAGARDGDAAGLDRCVRDLAARVDLLPDGDLSLRNALHELRRIRNASDEAGPRLARVLAILQPREDPTVLVHRLGKAASSAIETIEAERRRRLRDMPVDPARLERMRAVVEASLLDGSSEVPFFAEVSIGKATAAAHAQRLTYTLPKVDKAGLVDPPMQPASNLDEVLARELRRFAGHHAWAAFVRRPRQTAEISARVEDETFWDEVAGLVGTVGPCPTLVVSRHAEARAVRRLFNMRSTGGSGLRIEERSSRGSYVATVNGVDVHAAEFKPGVALLFSGRALSALGYAAVDGSGPIVTVTFAPEDDETGNLVITFAQDTRWLQTPVYELKMPDPIEDD